MEAALAGERVRAAAKRAGEPAMRRPDRRGRRCKLLLTLDVAPKLAEAVSRPRSRSRSTPNVSSGFVSEANTLRDGRLSARAAAGRPGLDDRWQLLHRPDLAGIERRARAEVVQDVFERLNLGGQLAGRRTEVAVFDLERGVRGPQVLELLTGAPLGAQADQHRCDDERGQDDRRDAQVDGHPTTVVPAIRDGQCVAARANSKRKRIDYETEN